MGRKKIRIAPIKDDRNRSVTFLKRKNGLFKKAYELGVLCSADVAIIIFGTNGKLYEFANHDVASTLVRYQAQDAHEKKRPDDFVRKALADRKGRPEDEEEDDEESDEEEETAAAALELGDQKAGERRSSTTSVRGETATAIPAAAAATATATAAGRPASKRSSPFEGHSRTPSGGLAVPSKKKRTDEKSPGPPTTSNVPPNFATSSTPMAPYGSRPVMPYANMYPQFHQPYMQMMGQSVPQGLPMPMNGFSYPHNGMALPGMPHPYVANGAQPMPGYNVVNAPYMGGPPSQPYNGGDYSGQIPAILHTQATPVGSASSASPRTMAATVSHHPSAVIMHSTQSPVNAMSSSLFAHIPPSKSARQDRAQSAAAAYAQDHPQDPTASSLGEQQQESPMTQFNRTWHRMTAGMGAPDSSSPGGHGRSESFSASNSATSPFSPKVEKMSPSSSLGITGVKKPKLSLHIPEPAADAESEKKTKQQVGAVPQVPPQADGPGEEGIARNGERRTTPPFALRGRHGASQVESPTSSMRTSLELDRGRAPSKPNEGYRHRTASEPIASSPLRSNSGSSATAAANILPQSPLSPASSGLPPSHHLKGSEFFASPSAVFPEFAHERHYEGHGAGHHFSNAADSAVDHGPTLHHSFFATGRNGDAFLPADNILPSPLNFGRTPVTSLGKMHPYSGHAVDPQQQAGGGGSGGPGGHGRASVYQWPSQEDAKMPPPRRLTASTEGGGGGGGGSGSLALSPRRSGSTKRDNAGGSSGASGSVSGPGSASDIRTRSMSNESVSVEAKDVKVNGE